MKKKTKIDKFKKNNWFIAIESNANMLSNPRFYFIKQSLDNPFISGHTFIYYPVKTIFMPSFVTSIILSNIYQDGHNDTFYNHNGQMFSIYPLNHIDYDLNILENIIFYLEKSSQHFAELRKASSKWMNGCYSKNVLLRNIKLRSYFPLLNFIIQIATNGKYRY